MPILEDYWFTSVEELDRLYSATGVNLRTDDGIEEDLINEIILWATETIAAHALHHYDITNTFSDSPWVRRRATILAAFYLSQRRANAPQFVAEAKRVMEDLEALAKAKILIPNVPVRAASVPAISSYRIDDRYWINKQRVVKSQSTKPYPGQQGYTLPFSSSGDTF